MLCAPGHCSVERRKTCFRSDVQQAQTAVTASRYDNRSRWSWLRDQEISNWRTVNHLWLADWCRQWLNVNLVHRRFITSSFFLFAADVFCQTFCRFFSMTTVNIFSSVKRNRGKYSSADVLNGWVLHGGSLHTAPGHCDFWSQQFHKVPTRLRCGGICSYSVTRNLLPVS